MDIRHGGFGALVRVKGSDPTLVKTESRPFAVS